ncbi:glycosyltransferase [Marinicrinis sediminis]|uniref:Glycosyltransferase n=1 Tax=Marinicrinis sediminis TaxID=1652465 RepID=A0ABW5R6L8_9BACL
MWLTFLLLGTMLVLGMQLAFVLWNLFVFRGHRLPHPRMHSDEWHTDPPLISVLIPARNEARNIAACIQAVQHQHYRNIEIIVLDDQSEDQTPAILEQLKREESRLQVLSGRPRPRGWAGKVYACHQLSKQARGRYLLFLDADARLENDAVARALLAAEQQQIGLITGFPKQVTRTWAERLVVPFMMFSILCHLPLKLVRGSSDPKFVAAHGGFMFFHRDVYDHIGGHEAIASSLVDDMDLARRVKQGGHSVLLADLTSICSMRMYTSFHEVWMGYQKNMYLLFGGNSFLLAAMMIGYSWLYVLSPVVMLCSLATGHWQAGILAALNVLLGIFIKAIIDRRNSIPWIVSCFLPVSVVLVCAIGLSSWLKAKSGKGYTWKGRVYH